MKRAFYPHARASKLFALFFLASLALAGAARGHSARFSILSPQAGDFTNFQSAANVFGQPNFTSATASAANFDFPNGASVDAATGKIFVADLANNRVLRFASSAALTNGAMPEAVFGQPDFSTVSDDTTPSKMSSPTATAVDAAGRLWVVDGGNNRLLRFDGAAAKLSGANADGVLGQADFTSSASGSSLGALNAPFGLFVDAAGRLWAADTFNNRVLRFDAAASKTNGAPADNFLGTGAAAVSRNGFNKPYAVAIDTGGRLYVADGMNNRVLRFDNAANKTTSANADAVFGQTVFTANAAGTTAAKLNFPTGVAADASSHLYVSDAGNNRVLVFNLAGTAANGASASRVLGQPDFTSGTANTGNAAPADNLFFYEPTASLFVADSDNNRVLRFAVPLPPTAAPVSISGRVLTGRKGAAGARIRLTDGARTIRFTTTDARGFYRFDSLAAGETYVLNASFKGTELALQVVYAAEDVSDLNFASQ